MSEGTVLHSVEGVLLTETASPVPGGLAATAYVVSTARTPQTWQFTDLEEAKGEFDAEVKRCREAGNRNA